MSKQMKKNGTIALVLCLALLPAFSLADGSTLRVRGSATLKAKPDGAILSIGYAAENDDAKAAQQETATAITAIVEAVRALDIPEENISTGSMSTYPTYDYTDGKATRQSFRVEHLLSVTVNDLDMLGDVIDAALDAGANSGLNLTYFSSSAESVYKDALAAAVEKAASKAESLAVAAGVWLGTLQEINEQTDTPYARASGVSVQYESAKDASLGGSVMVGDLDVYASVELVFAVR